MRSAVKKNLDRSDSSTRSSSARLKLRTRLTPSGWGFLGLIFCAFLMSVNYTNNLIFAMTFLLIAIALVGWYHTRMNLKGLIVASWRSSPVFAGQNAVYQLAVENDSAKSRHGLSASSAGIQGNEKHLVQGEQTQMTLARPTTSRGRLQAADASIDSCFPLGIFRARLFTGELPQCLVYPTPQGEQPLPDHPVGKQAHLQSESGTYTDMRRYTPGDPLSHIHWKAMARFDELYTKEFDGAQGKPALWLCWDDVNASGVEEKLSQLCRWVLDAHGQNREYGLEVPGTQIQPADGDAHLHNCLAALALYGESEVSP
ncbi:MAG TPA: DUF58 domain-containing protein [Phycisphaerales bacterium]|nr:DUF58 domain-containing protein [Phycisphaerales bacterium]HCD31268.1 DUF58 domain-containing protein [Phycisphaerales bacterium]|tara:strand:- start:9679 stop:10620 length:942 start_codon:yes stop_codon:yes gene_type:complete